DGYEEPRTIAYGSTPVTIRRPRVRESETPFSSEILPAYVRRFPELDKTMHELWLQGLSTRDFEPSLRALVGETAPLSPSSISRINKQFLDDYRTWPRGAVKTAHLGALENRTPVGGHLKTAHLRSQMPRAYQGWRRESRRHECTARDRARDDCRLTAPGVEHQARFPGDWSST
ncbi:MAG TPA: transposase, partial [Candidatus Baltobacteraceae bacterium]|nr:transposase [Candidatus Baltobacteraceae bacterium]